MGRRFESCRARHYISTGYASLTPIWDIFETSQLKFEWICLACSVKWFGARWAYRRIISIDSHPPVYWSTDSGTPDWINQLAHVCLRPWKRKSSIFIFAQPHTRLRFLAFGVDTQREEDGFVYDAVALDINMSDISASYISLKVAEISCVVMP